MAHFDFVGNLVYLPRRQGRGSTPLLVAEKATGSTLAELPKADAEAIDTALSVAAAGSADPPPPYERFEILRRTRDLVAEHEEELINLHTSETGFTLAESRNDVRRTMETLLVASEEAKRMVGEIVPVDGARGQEQRFAFTMKRPLGVVFAVTPFNSPLNTVAHKVAPAVSAGNAVILKPSSVTPLSALALRQLMIEAGLSDNLFNILVGSGPQICDQVLSDQRVRFLAFTGSSKVGRELQQLVGLRRSQMELGNISMTLVCEDADVASVVSEVTKAGFRKAGQVCTSVQRLLVSKSLMADVLADLQESVSQLVVGDPFDAEVDMGPMISEGEAERVKKWVLEAVGSGAKTNTPVECDGAFLRPVVVSGAPRDSKIVEQEVFGPVVTVEAFDEFEDAIAIVNNSPFGLAAGLYTSDWRRTLHAARTLRVGVLQIGRTSSSRVDLMPYGGLGESGFGKEGPKYAAEEMSEETLVVMNP